MTEQQISTLVDQDELLTCVKRRRFDIALDQAAASWVASWPKEKPVVYDD